MPTGELLKVIRMMITLLPGRIHSSAPYVLGSDNDG